MKIKEIIKEIRYLCIRCRVRFHDQQWSISASKQNQMIKNVVSLDLETEKNQNQIDQAELILMVIEFFYCFL